MSFSLDGYVDVAQRIRQLRAKHPEAVLRPADPANPFRIVDIGGREFIVYTAACYRTPDDPMPAIACAAEPVMGRTNYTKDSELMNAETSAWGRAIMAALAVDEPHIASANEVMNRQMDRSKADHPSKPVKVGSKARPIESVPADDIDTLTPDEIAQAFGATPVEPMPQREQVRNLAAVASQKQIGLINKLAREKNIADIAEYATHALQRTIESVTSLTSKDASALIKRLMEG
jgi:hypothetical protein